VTEGKTSKAKQQFDEDGEPIPDFLSLESFFDADQQVGETRVVGGKPKKSDMTHKDDGKEKFESEIEERRLVEASLRDRLGASENELEMAMGLSSFHAVDRRSRHKPVKTIAIEQLQKRGELSLSDLADMDYDTLVRIGGC